MDPTGNLLRRLLRLNLLAAINLILTICILILVFAKF